jgi:aminoglycoside phosphotransferase (APT) family kinase protein
MDASLPTTVSSSKSDLTLLEERLSISALETLACRYGSSQQVNVKTPPMRGSYNLVYLLLFPDGRKWVARIPHPECSDIPLMQSSIHTIGLIRESTTIPIPAIHAYDTSPTNELGVPYILMDFVEGVSLGRIWKNGEIVDDVARKHIFGQVAAFMSQLSALEFDKIGHLLYDEYSGAYSVGPYRRMRYSLRTDVPVVEESGPFTTTHAFLSHLVQTLIDSPDHHKPIFVLLRLLALSLPDPQYDGAPFVLSHPDFDSQNVLVDPTTFDITGFIDWDGVCVGPRLSGFARYPAWITRDWDPFIYDWRDPKAEESTGEGTDSQNSKHIPFQATGSETSSFINEEESPATLQKHRDLYLSMYSAVDPQNANITRQSHIFEALSIALHSPELAGDILEKLLAYVFHTDQVSFGQLVVGMEDGDWIKTLQMKQPGPDGQQVA